MLRCHVVKRVQCNPFADVKRRVCPCSEGQALLADVEKALAAVDKAKPKEKEAENLDSQIRGLQGKLGVLNNLMG